MTSIIRTAAIVVALATMAGCGGTPTSAPSDQAPGAGAITDTGASGGVGSVATGTDVGTDVGTDAGTGAGLGTDVGTSTGTDTGAGVGAGVGTGTDVGTGGLAPDAGVGTDVGTIGGGGGGGGMAAAPTESPYFYLIELMRDNNGELDLATMAQGKSTDGNVLGFAALMIEHHTAAGSQASAVAQAEGIPSSTSRTSEFAIAQDRLLSLRGKAFDDAWVRTMVAMHRKAVAMSERQAASASSGRIQALAADLLPELREHLRLAEQLATNLQVDLSIAADGRPVSVVEDDGDNTAPLGEDADGTDDEDEDEGTGDTAGTDEET